MYVKVHATAGAKKESVTKKSETEFYIAVREPRERNLANRRIAVVLAETFGVSPKAVRMLTGHRSSSKMYSIDVDYEHK